MARKRALARVMIGHDGSDQLPERMRMIELPQMAQFVHDDVIDERQREKRELVMKIEIPLLRAASPTRLLIADSDTPDTKEPCCVVERDTLPNERARRFLVPEIVAS